MRTTNQIIIAVQECEPVTEEELRLALVALSNIKFFIRQDLQKLIECVRENKHPKMQAEFAWGTIERMFKAMKTPPDQWLGPGNTPGTPEFKARLDMGKKIFKKATGLDL